MCRQCRARLRGSSTACRELQLLKALSGASTGSFFAVCSSTWCGAHESDLMVYLYRLPQREMGTAARMIRLQQFPKLPWRLGWQSPDPLASSPSECGGGGRIPGRSDAHSGPKNRGCIMRYAILPGSGAEPGFDLAAAVQLPMQSPYQDHDARRDLLELDRLRAVAHRRPCPSQLCAGRRTGAASTSSAAVWSCSRSCALPSR